MPKGERGTSKPYLRGRIWWIRYCVSGKPQHESSKSTHKRDAVKLLNLRRSEIDRRMAITSANVRIADLLELYLADQRQQRRAGYRQAKNYVAKHLEPAFGALKADALETRHLDSFIEQKRTAALGNATINHCLRALKRSYQLAVERRPRLAAEVPQIIKLLTDPPAREGFLDHAEYLRMREALADHLKLLLVIGYHLGLRLGEILKLRWSQVEWEANLLRLEARQTKTKKARLAPLFGELRPWLETAYAARDAACEHIISYRGKPIGSVQRGWEDARAAAGLPELRVHDLRRTAIRNMVRAGIPEKRVMDISGHRTRNVFERYNILDERDLREDGARADAYMKQISAKVDTKLVQSTEAPAVN